MSTARTPCPNRMTILRGKVESVLRPSIPMISEAERYSGKRTFDTTCHEPSSCFSRFRLTSVVVRVRSGRTLAASRTSCSSNPCAWSSSTGRGNLVLHSGSVLLSLWIAPSGEVNSALALSDRTVVTTCARSRKISVWRYVCGRYAARLRIQSSTSASPACEDAASCNALKGPSRYSLSSCKQLHGETTLKSNAA